MTELTNHDLFHLLHQKSRFIRKTIDSRLKEHNLHMSQWSILFCLDKFGSMTQTEIWTYLNVEAPTITRTLKSMEHNGWVNRKPGNDKRERILEMTKQAEEIFGTTLKLVAEMENQLLLNFSNEEKEQLYHLLSKIES